VCGVCADGIFGECLFWALKLVLGPEYDAVTHMDWVKIFSRVLRGDGTSGNDRVSTS
jgi:hypothetical protein